MNAIISKRALLFFLQGGLGNQLFQLCAGMSIQKNLGRRVSYSTLLLDKKTPSITPRILQIEDLLSATELSRLGGLRQAIELPGFRLASQKFVREMGPMDDPLKRIDEQTRGVIGYFQDCQIVDDVRDELLTRLKRSSRYSALFGREKSPEIGVHVRLTDYRTNQSARNFHGVTGSKYYLTAARELREVLGTNKVRIFSDEPKFLGGLCDLFTQANFSVQIQEQSDDVEDMITLAKCRAIVAANSTYSWWAGWLGSQLHGTPVIVPRPWFKDQEINDSRLVLASWQVMEREIV